MSQSKKSQKASRPASSSNLGKGGVPVLSEESGLSRYLREIQRFPLLEKEEELQLARRWRDEQDVEAAHQLVTSHLRLVAKIAMGYRGYGLPISEVVSEGNIGLMQAVRRFDPDKGFRLTTYAVWWIRAAIQEYVLRSWSLVKIGTTAAQKKLFFNLRRAKREISAYEEGDIRPEQVHEIATKLDVPDKDVVMMNRRLLRGDLSLNAPVAEEGGGEWQDWLESEDANQEEILSEETEWSARRAMLAEALKGLNERESHILTARRLKEEPETLEVLAEQFNISRERVRQIEVGAYEKLQKAIKKMRRAQAPPPSY